MQHANPRVDRANPLAVLAKPLAALASPQPERAKRFAAEPGKLHVVARESPLVECERWLADRGKPEAARDDVVAEARNADAEIVPQTGPC